MFKDAGRLLGVSKIDIYKYQTAVRAGQLREPLPHLFIISDEFAEMKTQQPEFLERLVSAARIGRELGVHLILATQKPAGVVDDQIWSNSRFRVCLKVQDRQDSMDMLKRPDAAELKAAGRFYMQVGYNEQFLLGQSAWAGAPYEPSADGKKVQDIAVRIFERNGQVIQTVQAASKAMAQNRQKQLDAIVGYIADIAAEERISVRPLWKEPLPRSLPIAELKEKYAAPEAAAHTLSPLVGECDDPERQRRFPLYLPLSTEGNAIIYGAAGSGKTTFLTAAIYELLCAHTAETLHLYLCDFGAETLRQFALAPQVGEVVTAADSEKVLSLLRLLREEIGKRKKLFAEWGGDFASYSAAAQPPVPSIVLVINNYGAFSELFEDQEDQIAYLSMEGTKYGLYLVLATATTNAIRYRMAQNFKQIFVLQLNDNSEYANVLGSTGGLYSTRNKGRGLVKVNDVAYEFQTAQVADNPARIQTEVKALCAALTDMGGARAKRVPILPAMVDMEFLQGTEIRLDRFPVGVNKDSLAIETLDLTAAPVWAFASADDELLGGFAAQCAAVLAQCAETVALRTEAQVMELLAVLVERSDLCKQGVAAEFVRKAVVIPDLTALLQILTADGQHHLRDIFLNLKPEFAVTFLIGDELNRWQNLLNEPWAKPRGVAISFWLGDGAGNYSYQLGINKVGSELYGELGEGFGLVLRKGKYRIAKLLQSAAAKEDDGDA